jgi:hypothetical protein
LLSKQSMLAIWLSKLYINLQQLIVIVETDHCVAAPVCLNLRMKEIAAVVNGRLKNLNKLCRRIIKDFDEHAIHEFRVEVKKNKSSSEISI